MSRNPFRSLKFSRQLFLSILFSWALTASAQMNMSQVGYLDIPTNHNTSLSSLWGYTDEAGNEYALVACTDGTSIVDISDPASPVEIKWIPGLNTSNREIKTYNDYAYVAAEANQGLLIIDLSPLPASTVLPTAYYSGPVGAEWTSAHNLYQADGYLYIFGSVRPASQVIILDVMTDPMNPIEIGAFNTWYTHDGFVRNDTGYFSNILDGHFSIVDLTDKTSLNVTDVIGTMDTPDNFTHNAWLSDDGHILFTTDEEPGAFIASYDISDPANALFLDMIQSDLSNDVIPHNVHVKGNYLIASYYTYGVAVYDISDPANMTEVGHFDTSPDYNGNGFHGCWGIYPYFASDLIIASDIEKGLYVLDFTPSPLCYLQGNVTSSGSGLPIENALIEILGTTETSYSNSLGEYQAETILPGVFEVRYSKPGYAADTISVSLVSGAVVTQDVVLIPLPPFEVVINVTDAITGDPVSGADVRIDHSSYSELVATNAVGNAYFDLFYDDSYTVTVGTWLYTTSCTSNVTLNTTNDYLAMTIAPGIYDDFTFDYNWTESGSAASGDWERAVPSGTLFSGEIGNPFIDNSDDCGDLAFVTGNTGVAIDDDDIDAGWVELLSPVMNLSGYLNPEIDFSYWFFNGFGTGTPNDSLVVSISNGTASITLETFSLANAVNGNWTDASFQLYGLLPITTTMRVKFKAYENSPEHITEMGIDHFRITESAFAGNMEMAEKTFSIYPNPATDEIYVEGTGEGFVYFYDLTGRVVLSVNLDHSISVASLERGMYLLVVTDVEGRLLVAQKQQIR